MFREQPVLDAAPFENLSLFEMGIKQMMDNQKALLQAMAQVKRDGCFFLCACLYAC